MKERIHQILQWTNLSQQEFANRLGISPASLSSIFTGRTNPTNNHVQAIHRSFPEINVSWLLFGEGDMMIGESGNEKLAGDAVLQGKVGDQVSSRDNVEMLSMFGDGDFDSSSVNDVPSAKNVGSYRDAAYSRAAGFQMIDNAKKNDKRVRKIKEIRVFFDDGTYEAFVPSSGK